MLQIFILFNYISLMLIFYQFVNSIFILRNDFETRMYLLLINKRLFSLLVFKKLILYIINSKLLLIIKY